LTALPRSSKFAHLRRRITKRLETRNTSTHTEAAFDERLEVDGVSGFTAYYVNSTVKLPGNYQN
jgi:hypothetical protein